jgi:hypothetical protein
MSTPQPESQTTLAPANALIPLWTWLAVLSVSVALFFHLASQGAPWTLEFGLKPVADEELAKSLAGMWGLLMLLPITAALYLLTLAWMSRSFTEAPQANRWDRLPSPEFWKLPSSDPVTKTLRVSVWLLVLLLLPFTIGHLARKHFGAEFYQQCRHLSADSSRCVETSGGKLKLDASDQMILLPPNPSKAQLDNAVRPFALGTDWQRFLDHISPKHLSAPYYFDHSFYFSKPDGPTYFPGLQAWAYLAGIVAVGWLWLRIVLSVIFKRMLSSVGATLRRLSELRFFRKLP